MSAQAQAWNDPDYDQWLDEQREQAMEEQSEDIYWSMRATAEEARMKEEGVF